MACSCNLVSADSVRRVEGHKKPQPRKKVKVIKRKETVIPSLSSFIS